MHMIIDLDWNVCQDNGLSLLVRHRNVSWFSFDFDTIVRCCERENIEKYWTHNAMIELPLSKQWW